MKVHWHLTSIALTLCWSLAHEDIKCIGNYDWSSSNKHLSKLGLNKEAPDCEGRTKSLDAKSYLILPYFFSLKNRSRWWKYDFLKACHACGGFPIWNSKQILPSQSSNECCSKGTQCINFMLISQHSLHSPFVVPSNLHSGMHVPKGGRHWKLKHSWKRCW